MFFFLIKMKERWIKIISNKGFFFLNKMKERRLKNIFRKEMPTGDETRLTQYSRKSFQLSVSVQSVNNSLNKKKIFQYKTRGNFI